MRFISWFGLVLCLVACGDGEPSKPVVDDPDTDSEVEAAASPGRVTLHRLNRAEYNNTVRDLLGTDARPADDFPADDHGYGFDNNADVLALSPFQLELYARAADSLVAEALAEPPTVPNATRYEAEALGATTGALWRDQGWQLRQDGSVGAEGAFPQAGRYTFSVRAFGAGQSDAPVTMGLRIGGIVARTWQVPIAPDIAAPYETTLDLEAGGQMVDVVALAAPYDPAQGVDQSLVVDWFQVTGPQVSHPVAIDTNGAALDPASEFGQGDRDEGVFHFSRNGAIQLRFEAEEAGEYRVSVTASGDQAGDEPAKLTLELDGRPVVTHDVDGPRDRPEVYQHISAVSAGSHSLHLRFPNDHWDADTREDRNLQVGRITVEGPLHVVPTNPIRDAILHCDATPGSPRCADQILSRFLRRAWRRPPTQDELARYSRLVVTALSHGDTFESGVALALRAALVSPHFLFRVELDPPGGEAHPLTDHELATRLSYFLWSSMPDEELLALADEGRLQDDEVLAAQTARMLADPRSRALTDNFAGQWLQTRALFDVVPDYNVFPDYDQALQYGLYEETAAFFEAFLHTDRPVTEMFTAEFTFANGRVAAHYGLDGVDGIKPQRVELDGPTRRRGILTHGSVLTVTSYPTRTSPVKRGKWVLSQLLCSEPPPPPPGVEGLIDEVDASASLRERLEQHRADPTCASCHALMDPIGFAMEEYDGIGRYRDDDHGYAIDPSGELVTGEAFADVHELADILAADDRVTRCVARHMTTYALGRGLEFDDKPYSDAIHAGFVEDGSRLSRLIHHIVQSRLFRWRQAEEE